MEMTIEIRGLKTEAIIGIYDEERGAKQPIIVNIKFDIKSMAHLTDRIEDTADYDDLKKKICKFVENSSFFLLESLCHFLLLMILDESFIYKASVELHKPLALGDDAFVYLTCKGESSSD